MISHLYVVSMGLRGFLLLFHVLNTEQRIPSEKNIICFIDLVFPKAGVVDLT